MWIRIVILSLIISGCSQDEALIAQLQENIRYQNIMVLNNIENSRFFIQNEYSNHPSKALKQFEQAQKIEMLAQIFLSSYKSFTDSSATSDFQELTKLYDQTVNQLLECTDSISRERFKQRSFTRKFSNSDKRFALLMANNILQLEKAVYERLMISIDVTCLRYIRLFVDSASCFDHKNPSYTINSPTELKGLIRDVVIDTVLRNGKKVQIDPHVKQEFIVASCRFDSLKNGNYEVKGYARVSDYYGYHELPFTKTFTIK